MIFWDYFMEKSFQINMVSTKNGGEICQKNLQTLSSSLPTHFTYHFPLQLCIIIFSLNQVCHIFLKKQVAKSNLFSAISQKIFFMEIEKTISFRGKAEVHEIIFLHTLHKHPHQLKQIVIQQNVWEQTLFWFWVTNSVRFMCTSPLMYYRARTQLQSPI